MYVCGSLITRERLAGQRPCSPRTLQCTTGKLNTVTETLPPHLLLPSLLFNLHAGPVPSAVVLRRARCAPSTLVRRPTVLPPLHLALDLTRKGDVPLRPVCPAVAAHLIGIGKEENLCADPGVGDGPGVRRREDAVLAVAIQERG